jgi:hypothetical protein
MVVVVVGGGGGGGEQGERDTHKYKHTRIPKPPLPPQKKQHGKRGKKKGGKGGGKQTKTKCNAHSPVVVSDLWIVLPHHAGRKRRRLALVGAALLCCGCVFLCVGWVWMRLKVVVDGFVDVWMDGSWRGGVGLVGWLIGRMIG